MVACMTANLTVAGLLEEAAERLRASIAAREPSATPELDAQLLLAHVLAVPRTRLKSHPEERPHPSRIEEYRRLLARHAAGEPVAYLTGYRHFLSLRLAVTPAVLIPRPETELLVERALALHPATEGRVADLGTGSGALARELPRDRARGARAPRARGVAAPRARCDAGHGCERGACPRRLPLCTLAPRSRRPRARDGRTSFMIRFETSHGAFVVELFPKEA